MFIPPEMPDGMCVSVYKKRGKEERRCLISQLVYSAEDASPSHGVTLLLFAI